MLEILNNFYFEVNFILITIFVITIVIVFSCIIPYKRTKERIGFVMKQLKNFPVPFCVIDLNKNKIIECNNLLYELFEDQDILKTNISDLKLFRSYQDYLDIKNDSNTFGSTSLYYNINDKNKTIDIKFNKFKLFYKKYLIAVFDDRTQLYRYIKNLGVFSSIVDQSSDGILITKYVDKDSYPVITYANDSIEKITGYSKKEFINKSLDSIFSLNVDEKTLEMLNQNIHSFEKTSFEYQYIKKDGEICWVQTDIIPVTTNLIHESIENLECSNIFCKNEPSEFEIYITLHQKNITDIKLTENISKSYIKKLKESIKFKSDYINNVIKGMFTVGSVCDISNSNMIINEILKILGTSLDVNRAYVFLIKEEEENKNKVFKLLYEWVSHDTESQINNLLTNRIILEEMGAYDLYVSLISNKKFDSSIEDIKEPRFSYNLILKDIQSFIIYPIFLKNELIGFVGLDDCNNAKRSWDDLTTETLKCFAENFSLLVSNLI